MSNDDDNGNDSTTIDGSDGSTFEIDAGDRQPGADDLTIPLIPGKDADAVELAVNAKLYGNLTKEQLANLDIPTPKEESASAREGDFRESMAGLSQSDQEISRLSEALAVLRAKAVKYHNSGSSVPPQLQRQLRAAKNSLNFQMERTRATTEAPATTMAAADTELLRSIYTTDFEAAVRRTMRMHGVGKDLGVQLTRELIATTGEENVLPQYSRMAARMAKKYPQSA